MFEGYTAAPRVGRRRRLIASMAGATGVYAGLGVALAAALASQSATLPAEKEVDVTFYKAPPPPPPPVAVLPPPSAPPPPAPAPAHTPQPRLRAPVAMPTEAPAEADPTGPAELPSLDPGPPPEGEPGGQLGGTPGGTPGGTGTGPAVPQGPVVLPAGASEPERLNSSSEPEFPRLALASGLEGEVIAKVVVFADGHVELVRLLKSDANFDDAVRAFLPTMRFRPAMYNGQPISVYRTIRFPFRRR